MTGLARVCGLGLAAALLMGLDGFRHGRPGPGSAAKGRSREGTGPRPRPHHLSQRLATAAVAAVLLGVLTRWPVAAVAGGVSGYFGRELLSPKASRQAPIERTEAVAAWTEQLRDTMAAAAGLQQAIVATAPISPPLVREAVGRAAASASRQPLLPVLLRLAEDLSDPTADLVVTALVLAASGEGQDLGSVLSTVAAAAREDAVMRRHVDASRARTRTAVRTITLIALVTILGLLVVGHGYMRPYSTVPGQAVLAMVLTVYGLGVALLHRMGRDKAVDRVLRPLAGIRP